MMCTCPKCHAKIELDLPEVQEAGTAAACPACNARFNVYRESFGSRALHRTGEISCASCGAELGPQIHCAACGVRFPDYLMVQLGRKKARKKAAKLTLASSPLSKPQRQATVALPSLDGMAAPGETMAKPYAGPRINNPLMAVVALIVIGALGIGGSVFYLKFKKEKEFAKSFVLETYCLQVGIERATNAGTKMSTEWKQRMDAGQVYTARISAEDEKGFSVIESKLNEVKPKLSKPPEKFATSGERLTKLENIYNKWHSLVQTPGSSLPSFSDAVNKLNGEYNQAVNDYKNGLPADIKAELSTASTRFKVLRPLL